MPFSSWIFSWFLDFLDFTISRGTSIMWFCKCTHNINLYYICSCLQQKLFSSLITVSPVCFMLVLLFQNSSHFVRQVDNIWQKNFQPRVYHGTHCFCSASEDYIVSRIKSDDSSCFKQFSHSSFCPYNKERPKERSDKPYETEMLGQT